MRTQDKNTLVEALDHLLESRRFQTDAAFSITQQILRDRAGQVFADQNGLPYTHSLVYRERNSFHHILGRRGNLAEIFREMIYRMEDVPDVRERLHGLFLSLCSSLYVQRSDLAAQIATAGGDIEIIETNAQNVSTTVVYRADQFIAQWGRRAAIIHVGRTDSCPFWTAYRRAEDAKHAGRNSRVRGKVEQCADPTMGRLKHEQTSLTSVEVVNSMGGLAAFPPLGPTPPAPPALPAGFGSTDEYESFG